MRFPHHLKQWLVPHHHNDHRPHLIRRHGLALVAAVLAVVQLGGYVLRPAVAHSVSNGQVLAYATDIAPVDLFDQTNQQREAAGLAPLHLDARLNQSATLKAQNMFAEDYWAHVSPDGIQPWHWFDVAGYAYHYAGENLAKDFDTSSGVMQGWMNSPGHRANILNPNYTDVGFAVMNGTLQGEETTLVVAHYGSPAGGLGVTATVPAATPRSTVQPAPAPAVIAPAPTPAPTPVPTLAPTPTPLVTPEPVKPIVTGQITRAAPAPRTYNLFAPLALTQTLNWHNLVTLGLLVLLLFVYGLTHMTVWRKGLRRWHHRRYQHWALFQVGGLALLVLFIAVSGFGTVG